MKKYFYQLRFGYLLLLLLATYYYFKTLFSTFFINKFNINIYLIRRHTRLHRICFLLHFTRIILISICIYSLMGYHQNTKRDRNLKSEKVKLIRSKIKLSSTRNFKRAHRWLTIRLPICIYIDFVINTCS